MPAPSKQPEAIQADSEIAKAVLHAMKADIDVPDDRVQARVAKGVVTLTGAVAREEQKRSVEGCVRAVRGVRGIRDEILIDPVSTEA